MAKKVKDIFGRVIPVGKYVYEVTFQFTNLYASYTTENGMVKHQINSIQYVFSDLHSFKEVCTYFKKFPNAYHNIHIIRVNKIEVINKTKYFGWRKYISLDENNEKDSMFNLGDLNMEFMEEKN